MNNTGKILLGVLAAAGLGLSGWGLWVYMNPPQDTATLPPVIPPAHDGTPPPNKGGTTVTDPRPDNGFPNNHTNAPAPVYANFKIGQDLYARFPGGAIVYTSKTPGPSSIYKTYPAGTKIGSFLNKESGGMIAIAVEEPGKIYGTNAKTVYVPDTKVYA